MYFKAVKLSIMLLIGAFTIFRPGLVQSSPYIDVPFVVFDSGHTLSLDIAEHRALLVGRSAQALYSYEMPTDRMPVASMAIGDGRFAVFSRRWISNNLELHIVQRNRDGDIYLKQVPLPKKPYYLQHAFVFDQYVFFVNYDVVTKQSRLRRLSMTDNGLEYDKGFNELITFSGRYPIDANIRSGALGNSGYIFCAFGSCYRLKKTEQGVDLTTQNTKYKVDLIDFKIKNDQVYVLYKSVFDDKYDPKIKEDEAIYYFGVIPEAGEITNLNPIDSKRIPYEIAVTDNGIATYRTLTACHDLPGVLRKDLKSMPYNSMMALGMNNYEARIAWSQVYYLNGIIDVLKSWNISRTGFEALVSVKEDLEKRLKIEMDLLLQVLETKYPWIYHKRYSLDREPMISMVSVSRILNLMERYASLYPEKAEVTAAVRKYLLTQLKTNDKLQESRHKKVIDGVERFYFKHDKYQSYYLDGVDVPYNFHSAYIESLVQAYGQNIPGDEKAVLRDLLEIFLVGEDILDLPEEHKWGYSWGVLYNGYAREEGVSSNTEDYAGDKVNSPVAHISYRSMDSLALLVLRNIFPERITEELVLYLKDGVENGELYPFVSEGLLPLGVKPVLSSNVIRQYARSSRPWELQNQIWALAAMAKQINCNLNENE